MNKLLCLPLLLALGCSAPSQPAATPSPAAGLETVEKFTNSTPMVTNCTLGFNSLIETDIKCKFHNGGEHVASTCIQAAFYRNFQKEYVMSTHSLCSGGVAPNEDRDMIFEIRSLEHTKLSHGCGRELNLCFMKVEPATN